MSKILEEVNQKALRAIVEKALPVKVRAVAEELVRDLSTFIDEKIEKPYRAEVAEWSRRNADLDRSRSDQAERFSRTLQQERENNRKERQDAIDRRFGF